MVTTPDTPLISIVIPTYNRADMLREALHSALNQTYPNFEIVVSDNASTDHTAEVVGSFNDLRIRYFRQTENIGVTPNWKYGVSQASADWITLLADDDHYLPDHLEFGMSVLRRHPTVTYHVCRAEYFGGMSGINYQDGIVDTTTPELYFAPRQAVDFLGIDHPGLISTILCRKADLMDVFWGPPGFVPLDLLVLPQLMVRGGFVFSNHVTVHYRVHSAMASLVGSSNVAKSLKFNLMVWYGVRYLAQFLLDQSVCNYEDIKQHGLQAKVSRHVVPLVLGLASFDASPTLRQVAKRIFAARRDMDVHSSRFRLARRMGFWILPLLERWSQTRLGWRPMTS